MNYSRMSKVSALSVAIFSALALPAFAAANTADSSVKTKDVIVTATRTEEEVKNVPNTVEVITQEDIQKLGATDVYSALRLASNVDVTPAGMAGHNVMIRGMNTNHTLVLIDGKRQAGEDTGNTQNVYALDRISLSNIDRIEIVRGAASAQYGSDALGGVINIITKKSEGKPSITVGASTSTNNINNYYHIDFEKQGKFSGTFDARFSKERKVNDEGSANSNMYGPRQEFNFDGTYDLGNNQNLNLNLGYYNEHSKANYEDAYGTKIIPRPTEKVLAVKDKTGYYDYKQYNASLAWSGKTDTQDYMIRAFYSKLKKDNNIYNYRDDFKGMLFASVTGPVSADVLFPKYDFNNSVYVVKGIEGKNSVAIGDKHLLTYGAEFRQSSVEGTNLGERGKNAHDVTQWGNGVYRTKSYSEQSINTWAAYVQDEWTPSDKWLIIPSVRYDHDSTFGGETTPKIGATYFINKNARFKANWGKAFKAPTVSELYMNMEQAMGTMGFVHVLGNSTLQPEESTNWDISLEGELNDSWGKLTYFHNDISNMIHAQVFTNPNDAGIWSQYQNIREATVKGVELELGHHINKHLTFKINSNWTDAMNETDNERIDGVAKNMTTAQLIYDDLKPMGISAMLWEQWTSNYWYSDGNSGYKDYTFSTTNFVVNKKFGENRRIYAGVDNLFNKKIDNIYLDGRVWRVGAEWKF